MAQPLHTLIDDQPGYDSAPGEWRNYLALLTPERFPDAKERARLRRDARRGLERSLDPERNGLDDPPHPLG